MRDKMWKRFPGLASGSLYFNTCFFSVTIIHLVLSTVGSIDIVMQLSVLQLYVMILSELAQWALEFPEAILPLAD